MLRKHESEGSTPRSDIEFAKEQFGFLAEYGFYLIAADRHESEESGGSWSLTYRGTSLRFQVYFEKFTSDLGFSITELESGELMTGYEVISSLSPQRAQESHWQATSLEVQQDCLRMMAKLVREECDALLRGSRVAIAAVEKDVKEMRRMETERAEFGNLLMEADDHWDAKRLPMAADLYESANEHLSETQRRRLDYIRKNELGL